MRNPSKDNERRVTDTYFPVSLEDNKHPAWNPMQDASQQQLLTLFRYHLFEDHLPSARSIVLQQLALLSLALVGLLYATPAAENAKTEIEGILNVIGTCFTACIVPCAATIAFYEMHVAPQYVPNELKDILNPSLTPEEYRRQNGIIGFFSLLSAIPFVTVIFTFKLPINLSVFIIFIAYVLIANTLLHFLPVKLTLQHPVYGALPKFLHTIALYCMNKKMKEEATQNTSILTAFSALGNAKAHFLRELVVDPGAAEVKLSNYQTVDHMLSDVLTYDKDSPKLSSQVVISARVIGVVTVCLACLGYIANPYLVFRNQFHLPIWAAALCTSPPMYFLGILLAFFGDNCGQRLLKDIALQGPDVIKLSAIARLYPVTMTILSVINLSLVYFSSAAANEMLKISFGKILPSWAMIALYVTAHLGLGLIAWYTPLDYEKILVSYYAQYIARGPQKSIMTFKAKFEALLRDMNRLKPEFFNALNVFIEHAKTLKEVSVIDERESFHSNVSSSSRQNFSPSYFNSKNDSTDSWDNSARRLLLN